MDRETSKISRTQAARFSVGIFDKTQKSRGIFIEEFRARQIFDGQPSWWRRDFQRLPYEASSIIFSSILFSFYRLFVLPFLLLIFLFIIDDNSDASDRLLGFFFIWEKLFVGFYGFFVTDRVATVLGRFRVFFFLLVRI